MAGEAKPQRAAVDNDPVPSAVQAVRAIATIKQLGVGIDYLKPYLAYIERLSIVQNDEYLAMQMAAVQRTVKTLTEGLSAIDKSIRETHSAGPTTPA